MTREGIDNRRDGRRLRQANRLAAFGASGGAIAFALLVVLAPAGMGAGTHGVILTAPFKGSAHVYSYSSFSGCGKEKLVVAPFAHVSTGKEGWSGWISAKTCKGSTAPAYTSGYIDAGWTFAFPFTVSKSGVHSLYADGNFSLNITVKISTSGTCPSTTSTYSWGHLTSGYCSAYAEANYNAADYIQDTTNGSIFVGDLTFSPGLSVVNDQTIYYGCYTPAYGSACFSYNSTYATPFTKATMSPGYFYGFSWDNGTLVKGHHYVFYYTEYHDVTAYVTGWPGGSAYSSENEATGGTGGNVTSIHIL